MVAALGLGLFGKKIAVLVATASEVLTVAGGLTGMVLLLGAPLSIQCATLTAYVIGMTLLFVIGFGMGSADEARLIRATQER